MIDTSQPTYSDFRISQQTFKSRDGDIKYIDRGEGEVLVLLHGVPTSGWLYRKMTDSLVHKGYRVIVPDMLGFGSSDSPKEYDLYTPQAHGKRLLALMDELKITNWTHVFHDAGGLWTWELFKLAPHRIKKLVILNSIIYEDGFKPPMRFEKGGLTKLSMSFYSNKLTNKTIMKKLFKNALMENNLNANEIEGYRKPLLEGKTNALYTFFSSTCNALPNYNETIKKINIPSMVIWGKHDQMLRWAPMQEAVSADLNIKPENIHMLDAKHYIQEENTDEIVKYILNFIN
jgi:haloalkane dehalogenase